jgi:hemerythrin superfamily protein
MFNWLLSEKHAMTILRKDHDGVKAIFDEFKKAESPAKRKALIRQAVSALKIHAAVEEEIFYPAIRSHVGADLMNEADEEHHVAKLLIAELDRSAEDDHRDAKFTVLAEGVRHHIKEEEGEIFPKAKQLDIDFEKLGERMVARKKELLETGVSLDAEHITIAKAKGKTDSSAAAARRRKTSGTSSRKPARKGTRHAHIH